MTPLQQWYWSWVAGFWLWVSRWALRLSMRARRHTEEDPIT